MPLEVMKLNIFLVFNRLFRLFLFLVTIVDNSVNRF